MKRATLFWIIAFIVTAGTGVFQRLTGPTYPLSGTAAFDNASFRYHLDRSFTSSTDARVAIPLDREDIRATLLWREFKSDNAWTEVPMEHSGGMMQASLPDRAPLSKLEYQIRLEKDGSAAVVPAQPVPCRFKGDVPLWVLLPHVLAMFAAMLFSLRAGLEVFMPGPSYTRLTQWTIVSLIVGGFIFGPLMSYYAFDLLWTGWPVGMDLTDNKTAIALLGWIAAAVGTRRSKSAGAWVLAAATVMFVVFLIPHSV